MSFQIYRNTSLGESLMETIEELAEEGKLPEEVALAILKQFDTVSVQQKQEGGATLVPPCALHADTCADSGNIKHI